MITKVDSHQQAKEYLAETCYRNKIVYLSFCLSVLVVLIHTYNVEIYDLQNGVVYWIEKTITEIADTAVPTFFVISGYLFFQNYSPNALLKKWKSRCFSVLFPYLIWNMFNYFYFFVISMIPGIKEKMNAPVNGFNLFDFLNATINGEYNGSVMWFMRCLIAYIIVTPLLFWIIRNKYGAVITMAGILILPILINKQVVHYWIFYVVGACLGIHGKSFMKMKFNRMWVTICTLYLLVSVIFGTLLGIKTDHQITIYTVLRLSQVMAIWVCANIVAIEKTPKWWMTISFFIYCSHSIVLESVEKVFLILFGKTPLGAGIDYICAPIITLSIVVFLAYCLRKVESVWILLTGSRGI